MKLSLEFRKRIVDDYFRDESWKKIIHIIDQNETLDENVAELSFVREFVMMSRESNSYMTSNIDRISSISTLKNSQIDDITTKDRSLEDSTDNKNLIYHVNRSTEEKRLCISSKCVSDILIIAHEQEQEHSDFEVTFEIISRFWYIRDLIKALRSYIRNCSQCLQIQIRRHRS
jgi:hypothetical protein